MFSLYELVFGDGLQSRGKQRTLLLGSPLTAKLRKIIHMLLHRQLCGRFSAKWIDIPGIGKHRGQIADY
jgi:hypothetical protein